MGFLFIFDSMSFSDPVMRPGRGEDGYEGPVSAEYFPVKPGTVVELGRMRWFQTQF
jgi:hypothetical protein